MQGLLELGDVKAREGDMHGAVAEWGACLDELSGCYHTVETAGASCLPPDPESRLRSFGLWGCMRGAAAAARLSVYGGVNAGMLGLGQRLEAARCSAALLAAPFCSSIAHPQRALDLVGLAGNPPLEVWNEVELSGSDMYRFDAATMCALATAVGQTVAAAGRPLEALPALAVAEHLAVGWCKLKPMLQLPGSSA